MICIIFSIIIVPNEPQPNLYFHPYIGTYIVRIWALSMIAYQVYFIYQRMVRQSQTRFTEVDSLLRADPTVSI